MDIFDVRKLVCLLKPEEYRQCWTKEPESCATNGLSEAEKAGVIKVVRRS